MLAEWAAALEGSDLASGLRNSAWAYPLVNAGHLHGVALLVGGSVPLNLRLLGVWRSLPLFPLRRVLARTADAGLLLAVTFGFLLFAARASEYIRSGLFVTKMLLLAAGIAGTAALRIATSEKRLGGGMASGRPPAAVRAVAGFSLAVWLAVLTLGRLIGYF